MHKPPVVSLEAEMLRARDAVRDPDLPNVVRLGGGRVRVDNVLDGKGKDLAARVAGQRRGRLRRQDEHDGPGDVGRRVGRDPGVVVGGLICVGGPAQLLARRGGAGCSGVVVVVLGDARALALLGLVALEGQWLDHGRYVVVVAVSELEALLRPRRSGARRRRDSRSIAGLVNGTIQAVLSRAGGCALLRQVEVKFGDGGLRRTASSSKLGGAGEVPL